MKVLALETSTAMGGAALVAEGQVIAQESSLRSKSHTENISVFAEECLKKANLTLQDIDVFAVGLGPGSFTGIRVAANAGKTYAYCYNKPMVAIDSLTLLAEQTRGSGHKTVLSIINAYKNMVYFGLFDMTGSEPKYIKGPDAVPVRYLKQHIEQDVLVVGDGWEAYNEYFPEELRGLCKRDTTYPDLPSASTLAKMAEVKAERGETIQWKSFTPLYIRASEAEETKRGILITPLK